MTDNREAKPVSEREALQQTADDLDRWANNAGRDELVKLTPSHCRNIAARIRSLLVAGDAAPPLVGAPAGFVQVPRALFDAWRGMCFGTDWNTGTAAKHHRATIERGMRAMSEIPGEPSSFAAPAPSPATQDAPSLGSYGSLPSSSNGGSQT